MCTVSYLPENNTGFILTSNRDESVNRSAELPEFHSVNGNKLLFPKDAITPGSWIVASLDVSVCLLNGGFEAHTHRPPYRKSRGLVCLDLACLTTSEQFLMYDLTDIEPFTALRIEHNRRKLFQFVWDGKVLDFRELDSGKPHFWSSSTLYSESWRNKRKSWFSDFLSEHSIPSKELVFDFHRNGGDADKENGFIMSRKLGILKTISITQIHFSNLPVMKHLDLLKGREVVVSF